MRHKHFNLCQNVLYSRQSRHMSSTFKPIRTVYGMVQIVLFVRNVLFVNQFLWHISVLLISQADYVDMFPICFNYLNHYVSLIFMFFQIQNGEVPLFIFSYFFKDACIIKFVIFIHFRCPIASNGEVLE